MLQELHSQREAKSVDVSCRPPVRAEQVTTNTAWLASSWQLLL